MVIKARPTVVLRSAVGVLSAGAIFKRPPSKENPGIGKNETIFEISINKNNVEI